MLYFVRAVVKQSESVVLSEFLDHFRLSGKVEHIALLELKVRRSQFLIHCAYESVLTAASAQLEDIDSVFLVNVQICDSLADCLG